VPGRHTLFLCDVRMPGLGGLAAIAAAHERDPELAIVVLTAAGDAATARAAFLNGASDYLTKPVGLDELRVALERALRRRARALAAQSSAQPAALGEPVAGSGAGHTRAGARAALRSVSVQVADTLVTAMEAKDEFLRGRSARVADLAASVAAELSLDEDTIEDVRLAGRLHDVGYIGVREAVLRKPDALTPEEYAEVQRHVDVGLEILGPLKHLGGLLQAVADHHERWDGAGYPRGLAGEAISLGGRILAGADAYDAITSARAYRGAMTPATALDYLATRVGTQFDARVYAAMRRVVERGSALTFLE
jgi:HD-GYP domain-containing protein (c-di-GMP phosphodiesterase class II)